MLIFKHNPTKVRVCGYNKDQLDAITLNLVQIR